MDRIVPVKNNTANLLNSYIKFLSCNPKDLIFLNADNSIISRRSMSNKIQRLAFQCGFKNSTSHTLRRSCATNLLNKGVGIDLISKLLGHKDENSLQPYLSISLERLKSIYEKCHPRY